MEYVTDKNYKPKNDTAIALGKFDGLHLGHMKLIETLIGQSRGLKSMALSFYPHPIEVLKGKNFSYIYSEEEKINLFSKTGVDIFFQYPFDLAFAAMEPEEFVSEVLLTKLRCKKIIVGEGYRFGKNQSGDPAMLKKLGKIWGFEVIQIADVFIDGAAVSSTRIRELLFEKDFAEAEKLLGRPYFIEGRVESGKKLGRTIGFPTVNIIVPDNKLIPQNGVYVTACRLNGNYFPSVSNVGSNPTVGGTVKKCETHIFDYKGASIEEEQYGEHITVEFFLFLRGEQKFNGIAALKNQIAKDSLQAGEFWRKKNS